MFSALQELIDLYGCRYENNILLFQKGPLSLWHGAFEGQSGGFRALIDTAPEDGEYFQFNCGEQFVMASKAALFKDWNAVGAILMTSSPREQQSLGRQVKNFDQQVWDREKLGIYFTACTGKFHQNPELRRYLTQIPRHCLIAEGTTDKVWGIGMTLDDPSAFDVRNWPGQNLLGRVLMEERDELYRYT